MAKVKIFVTKIMHPLLKSRQRYILSITVLSVLSAIFLCLIWNANVQQVRDDTIRLAQTTESIFCNDMIGALTASSDDINKAEYQQLKDSLMKFVELNRDVRFAYLYTLKDGNVVFLVDSEPSNSVDYSPPGQEYTEASPDVLKPFLSDRPVFSGPTTDRWGTWVSVLVPVNDEDTGGVSAVFGIDYSVAAWNMLVFRQTMFAGLVVLFLFFILTALYRAITKNDILQNEKNKLVAVTGKLEKSEALFRAVFEKSPVGIVIGNKDKVILDVNTAYAKIVGRTKPEIISLGWRALTHPDDISKDLEHFRRFQAGETDSYSMVKRYIRPDGSIGGPVLKHSRSAYRSI